MSNVTASGMALADIRRLQQSRQQRDIEAIAREMGEGGLASLSMLLNRAIEKAINDRKDTVAVDILSPSDGGLLDAAAARGLWYRLQTLYPDVPVKMTWYPERGDVVAMVEIRWNALHEASNGSSFQQDNRR